MTSSSEELASQAISLKDAISFFQMEAGPLRRPSAISFTKREKELDIKPMAKSQFDWNGSFQQLDTKEFADEDDALDNGFERY